MNTPICDFVRRYTERNALRLHMPGHKGTSFLGCEHLDLTEITGADSLYEASGIIAESESNASSLFGCPTYYSTEGSSQCIRAMLYLAVLLAKKQGKRPLIAAGRNVHKTFLSAAALLNLEVTWLCPKAQGNYLSCPLTDSEIEAYLASAAEKPAALYLTSPDYLGNTVDISAIAQVCRRYGVLLLVDNAHGAYLRFLPQSKHPIDLGADLCCDSAHKTLPALTGSAYLHHSPSLPFSRQVVKNALALFGSTSPSYLILQSLDAANAYLADGYKERLAAFLPQVQEVKDRLTAKGYPLLGSEPMKLTISAKPYGYMGTELAALLRDQDIVCEFSDPDFLVLMLTPETGEEGLARLETALRSIHRKATIAQQPPRFSQPKRVLSIREATLSPCEMIPAEESEGRILSAASVGCPPAVPIVVSGERIDHSTIECFAYYGIEQCAVVTE